MTIRDRGGSALQLKILFEETNPAVWRRLLVPTSITLHGFHRVIQLMMGWYDYHLYEFTIHDLRYELPMDEAEGLDSTGVTLGSLKLKKGEQFSYTYDFGDDWRHNGSIRGSGRLDRGGV
jgi:hypothetical protein